MATVYGSYVSSAFRSRADISTSTSNTQVTISVTGYCQMADYYHDSGENFFRKIVIGSDTPNKYVTASTAYFSGGGTYGVGSSSRKYTRTHSAQSIEVGVAIHNDGVYTGWSTADSYARTTVTVPAKPSYAVTYNANGGSSTPSSQTKWYGESLTLASAISRSNASATGYKVTYNANGGSCSTSSATAARTTKYTFSKWNTKSDGSGTAYSAGASYTGNAALTLYATWTSSTTTSAVTLPTPSRTGYAFDGWYTAASGGTRVGGAGGSYTPTGAVTLHAHWTQNTWTVSYAANGGSSTPASQTKLYGQALTLRGAISRSNATATYTVSYSINYSGGSNPSSGTATKTTKYSFNGWKATNGTVYAAGGSYTANAATTMTAQWTSSASTTKVTLPTPTRTGYTFGGWYRESACTNKVGNGGASYTPTASIQLFAKWTVNTWTVAYSANGGTGAPASQTKTYGQTLTLSSSRPSRSGYTFLGWATKSDGTGTAYSPGGSYTANAAATLYAVWVAVQVTSLSAYRSNSAGTRSDSGTYGHLSAGWKAMGTIAGTVAVTATANDASVTSSLSNRSGSKTATADLSNTSVGTFGGSYAQDVAVRVSVTATLTVSYGGSSRSVSATRVATIPKVFRLLDALHGGTGLAIGAIATLANTFEVALSTIFRAGVKLRNSNINRDGTAPSSDTWGDSELSFQDMDGERVGFVNVQHHTDGGVSLSIAGEAEATDGTDVYTTLKLIANRDKTGHAALGGSHLSVRKVLSTARDVSYIAGANGDAALYAPKSTTDQYYPAVCLDTNGGGSWSIGNYNDEALCFVYATKANRDSNTNTVSVMKLNSGAGTIYTTTNKPSASDVGALPIGGGTLTGSLTLSSGGITTTTAAHIIKDTRFDRDGANPSDDVWSVVFGFMDKDNEPLGYLQAYQLTNGTTGLSLYTVAEDSKGGTHSNFIRLAVDKSGNKAYSVGDAAAFRSAIGAIDDITTSSKTVSLPANSSSVSVTAPSVSGYTFVCWLQVVAGSGHTNPGYMQDPKSSTTKLWSAVGTTTGARNWLVTALYKK